MCYVGVDQHSKQLTVNIRNEAGIVVNRRQVSTTWESVRAVTPGPHWLRSRPEQSGILQFIDNVSKSEPFGDGGQR